MIVKVLFLSSPRSVPWSGSPSTWHDRTGSVVSPLDVNIYIAYAYDNAGNFAFDIVSPPCKFYQGSRIHFFKNFEFVNNYRGYLGKNFIFADFII